MKLVLMIQKSSQIIIHVQVRYLCFLSVHLQVDPSGDEDLDSDAVAAAS